jgi:hypothetical protein
MTISFHFGPIGPKMLEAAASAAASMRLNQQAQGCCRINVHRAENRSASPAISVLGIYRSMGSGLQGGNSYA